MRLRINGQDWTADIPEELYVQSEKLLEKESNLNFVYENLIGRDYDGNIISPLSNHVRKEYNQSDDNLFVAMCMHVILELRSDIKLNLKEHYNG